MMNIRFLNKHFDKQQLRPWLSICLSFLLLLSCTTPPLTSIKDSPSPISASQVAEKKRQLRLSKPTTALTSVTPQSFQLKGEDEIHFDLPLTLPIIGSRIKTGSGALELSNRPPDGWHPAGLVTASASVSRSPNGDLNLNFEAGKYSGATTFYINASTVVPGNLAVKKGETITGNVDPNARYTISNDNGTAPLRYYAFDSGSLSATVNEDNVSVKLSGVTASKLTQVQCFSWGTGSSCNTSTDPNNQILSGEIEFIIPVTTSSLGLKLNATQDLIGNNTANESGNITTQSEISLDSLGSLKDWRIEIKKEGSESTGSPGAPAMCMTHAIVGGSGKKDKAATLDANSLGNGTYQVTAYYVDHPEEKAELTVEVDNLAELRVIGDSTFIPLEENVQIQATYPACDSGKVQLSGSIFKDLIFEGDYSLESCSLDILAKAGGLPSETKIATWDGSCGEAPGIDFWNSDLFVGESVEDTEELELLSEIPICDDVPLLPEDLNGIFDGINILNLSPDEGFALQAVGSESNLKVFSKSKSQMQKMLLKLSSLGYPTEQIQENSTINSVPVATLFPSSNKVQNFLTSYFETKALREDAKRNHNIYLENLKQKIVQLKTYSQEYFAIPFGNYEGEQRTPSILLYKKVVDDSVNETLELIAENTVPDLLLASQTYTNLLSAYYELSDLYLKGEVQALEGLDEYEYEKLNPEKLNTPLQLITYSQKKLEVLREKLNSRKSGLTEELNQLFTESEQLSIELDELDIEGQEIDQEYEQLLEEWEQILTEDEETRTLSDFSIQSRIENPVPEAGFPGGFYGRSNIPGSSTNYARQYYSKASRPVTPPKLQQSQLNQTRVTGSVRHHQTAISSHRLSINKLNQQIKNYDKALKQAQRNGDTQSQQRLSQNKDNAQKLKGRFQDSLSRHQTALKKAQDKANKAQKNNSKADSRTKNCIPLDKQGGVGKTPKGNDYNYGPKIGKQGPKRGWDQERIEGIIDNPKQEIPTRDIRFDPKTGKQIDDGPATAFYNSNNEYVVINNNNGNIVQVSNRNDAAWIPSFKVPE